MRHIIRGAASVVAGTTGDRHHPSACMLGVALKPKPNLSEFDHDYQQFASAARTVKQWSAMLVKSDTEGYLSCTRCRAVQGLGSRVMFKPGCSWEAAAGAALARQHEHGA